MKKLVKIYLKDGQRLPYGENPHQRGVFYPFPTKDKLALSHFKVFQGEKLSFNNILDIEAALNVMAKIGRRQPACGVIKHGNPCGAALGKSPEEAFRKAWEGDPLSAFGGIIAINREIEENLAKEMIKNFFEILLTPKITKKAGEIFKKKPTSHILVNPALEKPFPLKEKRVEIYKRWGFSSRSFLS